MQTTAIDSIEVLQSTYDPVSKAKPLSQFQEQAAGDVEVLRDLMQQEQLKEYWAQRGSDYYLVRNPALMTWQSVMGATVIHRRAPVKVSFGAGARTPGAKTSWPSKDQKSLGW